MASDNDAGFIAEMVQLGRQRASGELLQEAFNVHGVKTRLVTNSQSVARAVAGLLRAFKLAKSTASTKPDIEVFLFTVGALDEKMAPVPPGTSMLYDWETIKIYHSGRHRFLTVASQARVTADIRVCQAVGFIDERLLTSDWLISHLVFYPLWGQLLKEVGLYPFHAAGLARNGKAFLFPGRSGSGKSTLSLQLVKNGYRLLSDDTVFLREKDGKVEALSFPEEINVTDETIKLFPDLKKVESFTINELRHKSSFSIEELYPGCMVDASVPVLLVFPQIAEADTTAVTPLSRTEALAMMMRYGFFFMDPSTTSRHFEILSLLARQTESYRLYLGKDQEKLEQTINGLLAGKRENHLRSERKE